VQLGCPAGADGEGQTALDHAKARQGKDPVLRHIADFLASGETQMSEAPWITHAKRPVPVEEAPAEAAAAATGAAETDIFEVEQVGEGAEEAADDEAPALKAAPPAAESKAAAPAPTAADAPPADLDELD